MNDEQLLRYSRQILLPQIGIEGQQHFLRAQVLIVGAGGLGAPAAMYLAAAGVGRLQLADFDQVELSNLQRQIIHRSADIGRLKVDSAADTLKALNPHTQVSCIPQALAGERLEQAVREADVVLDCTDNFAIRFALNRACVQQRTPLVSGAAIRMEGQITTFLNARADSPCYHCLYKDEEQEAQTCTQNGVLAPVVGIIGSMQATEALKILSGLPTLCGKLLILDALHMDWRSITLKKDPHCPVCGQTSV